MYPVGHVQTPVPVGPAEEIREEINSIGKLAEQNSRHRKFILQIENKLAQGKLIRRTRSQIEFRCNLRMERRFAKHVIEPDEQVPTREQVLTTPPGQTVATQTQTQTINNIKGADRGESNIKFRDRTESNTKRIAGKN